MAISVVQRATGTNNMGAGTTVVVTMGSNVTAGNSLIAVIGVADRFNTGVTGIADTQLSTWTKVEDINGGNSAFSGHVVYVAPGITEGAEVVTATVGLFADNMHVYEVSGLATSSFDVSNWGQQSASPFTVTTATTTQANELVIGIATQNLAVAPTWTGDSNFSNIQTTTNNGCMMITEERIVSSTGTQAHTVSSSNSVANMVNSVVTFKAATVVTAATTPTLLMMGV